MEGIVSALLAKAIDKKDPVLSNVGVKNRLDAIGALCNDIKAQWNVSVTATKLSGAITAADYAKTFTEV